MACGPRQDVCGVHTNRVLTANVSVLRTVCYKNVIIMMMMMIVLMPWGGGHQFLIEHICSADQNKNYRGKNLCPV